MVILQPFQPLPARPIQASLVMDTTDMTFNSAASRDHYPSIPATTLTAVVRRTYAPPA
jgi:hypothetical protein